MIRILPFLFFATPALAQQFTLPQGCEAYLTIQGKSCYVSHHFTCEGDVPGLQRRVDMNEDGMTYAGAIDSETQWIESFHAYTGHTEQLENHPVDPANLTELIETDIDTYDFKTLSDMVGETRYVGRDTLTGEVVLIDGVTLLETTYDIRVYAADGTETWRSVGTEYVSEDWRMFVSGRGTTTTPDDSWDSDDTPVEFINPGEPGFLSVNPKFGCGEMMSKREITQ